MKNRISVLIISATIIILIYTAGCTGTQNENTALESTGYTENPDELYRKAKVEMENANYNTASGLFEQAYTLYKESGDSKNTLAARNGMLRSEASIQEFPFNRTGAEESMKARIPGITDEEIDEWLENSAQKIESDGEILYFMDVSSDYLYENFEILQKMNILDFDYVSRYAIRDGNEADGMTGKNPYINPIRYTGTEKLDIPGDILPENGILKIWIPLPVKTDSQNDIIVQNLSYTEYIVNGPVTTGEIGYVCYEIPIKGIEGDLVITADIGFTSYEQIFNVDPEKVEPYNKGDPDYILYTQSERNIEITDDIRKKAKEIVGNETNPYLQAQLIYNYIITTYPYSHVPHGHLDLVDPKIAESTYMFETGHGDCGTQSMLFSALCRSLGIPARAIGGYQMVLAERPGTHFWAEYYIEGYGWIPCDTTVADVADWTDTSDENRETFKKYYSSSLDPTRYVIQKNVDVEMSPDIPDDVVVFRIVRQTPAIVSDSSEQDLELLFGNYFTVDLLAKT